MPLNIKNPEADRLARELADATGESLNDAVIAALEERLQRVRGRVTYERYAARAQRVQERVARLPRLDRRSDDEILGYDAHGLPG